MHQSVSEDTQLRDPRVPATCPDGIFVNRGWFLKLIIAGLAVMTLLGAAACGGASGSDGSGSGEQGIQEDARDDDYQDDDRRDDDLGDDDGDD